MIMGHKNWNAKKEDEKMPTLLDFQGLMRECQKEYLVHFNIQCGLTNFLITYFTGDNYKRSYI